MKKLLSNARVGAYAVQAYRQASIRERLLRGAWLGSTAIVAITVSTPAMAQATKGGNGGTSDSSTVSGAGGTAGVAGGVGTGSTTSTFDGTGGGGGGAGAAGGAGGGGGSGQFANGGTGGAAGVAGVNGGAGGAGGDATQNYNTWGPAGGGGGGGGNGLVVAGASTISTNLNGGTGGKGGNSTNGGGGGGGAGGLGLQMVTGANVTVLSGVTLQGGQGGAGGNTGTSYSKGGQGGSGGAGVAGTGTLINAGTILTGTAGVSGTGNAVQAGAATGASAVSGGDLFVTNTGTITGDAGADSITFTNGSNGLTLSAGGTQGTLNGTIGVTGSLALDPGSAAATSITFANVIRNATGAGSVSKVGAGTLTLTGANTYTGGTTFGAGVLSVGSAGAIGTTGTLSFTGGTLQYSAGNTIDYSARFSTAPVQAYSIDTNGQAITYAAALTSAGGSLVKLGTGTLSLGGVNTYTGTTTIGAGTMTLSTGGSIAASAVVDNGTFDVSGHTTGVSITSLSGTGGVTLGANVLTLSNANDTFGGVIASNTNGNGLTITGGTEVLTGANTFTGTTTLNGGNLTLGNGGNTGSVAGPVAMTAGTLTINQSGAVTLGGLAGAGNLVQAGTGTTTLSAANSYTGTTTIQAGTLTVGNAAGLPSSSSVALTGATAILNLGQASASTATINNLSGVAGSQVSFAGKGTINQTANAVFAGTLTSTFVPVPGFPTLTKTGGGTLTLTGTNNVNNATISAGTLSLSDGGSLNNTVLTINGSTFDVSGITPAMGALVRTTSIASLAGNANGVVALGNTTLRLSNAAGTFVGTIGGAGGLAVDAGTQTLSGTNGYTGATTIASGATLALANAGSIAASSGVQADGTFSIVNETGNTTIGALTGAGSVMLGGNTLTIANAAGTFSGLISDDLASGGVMTGGLTLAGGTEVLTGTNTYTGTTTLNGGNLTLGNGGTTGSVAGPIALTAGTLTINRSNAVTFGQVLSGAGNIIQVGTGTTTLGGADTYTGTTTISAGTLALGALGSIAASSVIDNAIFDVGGHVGSTSIVALSGSGAVTLGANTLLLTAANGTYAGVASGTGGLTIAGGAQTLTGANTYTGTTTVTAGTLSLGNGGVGGSVVGPIVDNATLILNRSDNYTLAATISGTGVINKNGTATSTFTGANSAAAGQFTGTLNINAGILSIGGAFGDSVANAALVNVNIGGTLHGSGTIDGSVLVNNGGTVSAGNSPGTLTVAGNYTLGMGSTSLFELGTPGVAGGTTNDLINVGGNLTLGGTLALVNSADATMAPAAGDYRLFNYGGTIAGQFATITSPMTMSTFAVTTNVPGQVNLSVAGAGQSVQYYDGTDTTAALVGAQGGTGPWNATTTNWTNQTGTVNAPWRSGVGIFTTTGGTVTVSGAQAVQGLQFSANGYTLGGTGSLTLTGDPYTTANQSFVTVDAGVAATIITPLTGAGIGLIKYGMGTLILSGANSYTGVTTVSAGVLQGTTSSIVGSAVVDNATLAYNQTTTGTAAQAISGTGVVQVNGGGNVSLTGAITASGGVQIGATTTVTLSNVSGSSGRAVSLTGAGATVNVAQGGTVTTANGYAVYGNQANAVVNNAGTISATNLNYTAVVLTAATGTSMITNAATGTISGYGGVYGNAPLTLANAGQITAAGAGGNAVTANGGGTIVNTGTLSATTAGGWGVQMSGAGSVDNQGTINADSGLVSTSSAAPSFTNEGTITAASNGVWGYGTAVTLTNTGTITGGGSTGTAGVRAEAAGSSIANSGTIQASSTAGVGVYMTGGTLTNRSGGTISGGTVAGGGYGTAIQLAGSGNMLALQAGSTVNGRIDASGTTDGSNSYTFSGTVNGGFTGGSGNDTVTLVTPVTVTGTLDGGAGTDTLVLDGTGAGTLGSAQVVNVENGVKQGSGTWTLTGTTAASPTAFAINAGTLAVAGGNALADTSAVTIASAGTLQLNASETIGSLAGAGNVALGANTLTTGGLNASPTFSGVIAGSGGLTKVGTGTLTLSGANTYTGATTVNAGTLALGANNAVGAQSALGVATGATFDLAGYNETVGTLAGSGTLALGAGTLSAGGTNADYAFGGTVTGTGDLTKVGTGTFSLVGNETMTGRLNVNAGTLMLAGTTAGSVRVQGGTLTGSSAIAGNLLLSSGTLSPGIATQPVGMIQAGSLTVSGGTTVFDFGGMASGFTADLLKVTGAATLTGGTVTTRGLDSSANYKMEQTYTVVQAGSLTGTYASGATFTQVSNNADLYYRLRYDLVANGVVLEVRKPVDFTTTLGTGATGNQLAIAGALNGGVLTGSDAFVTALNAISQLSPDQRRSTLDNIGGESIADISTSVALVGNRFNALLRQRVAVGAAGNSADPSLIAGIAGGRRGLDQVRASGQVGAEGSSFADGHADNHAGAWVQTFGGAGTLDGLGGTASIKDQSYGVAAGIDAKVAGLSIGGAFAASALDTRVEGRSATNRGTLYQGGGYVAYDDGTAYASAVGSYFSGDVTSTRQVYIGSAFQGTATGTPRVTGYTAGGSAGYRLPVGGGVRFTPQASFQATHVARDAFTETGAGVLSLSAARDVRTLYTATAEGRLSYLSAAPGGIVEPYVGAGAAFAFGDLNTLSANRFTGAPTGTGAFSVTGARLSPTTALVNGGIEAHPNDRVTLGMGVEGRLSNRQRDGRVELHVRLGF